MCKAFAFCQAWWDLTLPITDCFGSVGWRQVTIEKQREAFRKALMEVEDWLYTDGEAEKAPVFRCACMRCCFKMALEPFKLLVSR